jgi:hypothetical protein
VSDLAKEYFRKINRSLPLPCGILLTKNFLTAKMWRWGGVEVEGEFVFLCLNSAYKTIAIPTLFYTVSKICRSCVDDDS